MIKTKESLLDWAETLLCNALPMPHCTEWDVTIKKWRDAKHDLTRNDTQQPKDDLAVSSSDLVRRNCANCEHFLPIASNDFQGKCRRYPPAFYENAMFLWPTVAVGSWCGEFKTPDDRTKRQ